MTDSEFLSHRPHCLAGRATAVVSAEGYAQDGISRPTSMVCKIYHPEVQRRHEGRAVQVIHRIAEEHNTDMHKHLPSVLFYAGLPGCTTQRIRSVIKRGWMGDRTLRIISLKKLNKITSVVEGAAFIKAWLEVVTCHSFLWKHYVEHGDPSLSNIMYDPEAKCGVLSDFDLSILQREPRILGTDRTGTVPFMAISLLDDDYWQGKIKRFFHHELESFIWVLAYVSLVYDNGVRQKNANVDAWITSDYIACRRAKLYFYDEKILEKLADEVQPTFQAYWSLVQALCSNLCVWRLQQQYANYYPKKRKPKYRVHPTVEPSVPSAVPSNAPEANASVIITIDASVDPTFVNAAAKSEGLWSVFLDVLSSYLDEDDEGLLDVPSLLGCLMNQKPSFAPLTNDKKEELRKKYHSILHVEESSLSPMDE